ncbi:hypothetical protein BH24ACT12_BH24ACT12_17800 [soil metagenome]
MIATVAIAVIHALEWPVVDLEDIAVATLLFSTAWLLGDSARSRA